MPITTLAPLPLRHVRRGKVREVYAAGHDRLLLVATDRVSAFDVVMNEAIPRKGAVLTQLTAWWLTQLANPPVREGQAVRHQMISADAVEIIDMVQELMSHSDALAGR